MEKVSIIVPVYNMAADGKLAFCMDSLLAQSYKNIEIIAVDDASTDDSLAVLQEYEKAHPEVIRVITYPDNRRQGGAKNVGLQAATGDWISFIDSDDWISHQFLEKLLAKAQETGADIVGCDYQLVSEHSFAPGKAVQNNTLEQTGVLDFERHKSLFMRPGSMVIKIYRAEVIRENRLNFPEGIFYEDNCAGSVWSAYFTHFEKVKEPLYYYYQHASSTVHRVTVDKCKNRMAACEKLLEECKNRGLQKTYAAELEYRFTELFLVNTLFSYLQGVERPKLSFVKGIYDKALQAFPNFRLNAYYQSFMGEEEKKWIALLDESALRFFLLYRAKFLYRRMRQKG